MDCISKFIIPREATQKEGHFRPNYHFSSPQGWINDPNGLIFFNGWYHLFYQHNPDHLVWASMYWGHAVSKDLLHWMDLPIAMKPDMAYDECDEGGCFSGSAVVHDNKLYVFYTGSVVHGEIVTQTQNLAISEDGVNFTKYNGNPIIAAPPSGANSNFRDPKVFREGDMWYMVVGGCMGDDYPSAAGRVFLYRSEDLFNWHYFSTIYACDNEKASMLECPDFFPLNGKWVLTTSPISKTENCPAICVIGEMDFSTGCFTPEKEQPLDYGGYWYAPQSFLDADGRRIQIAWQNTWQFLPWFNDWGPTEQENWRGAMSVPHVLTLDQNNNLCSAPINLEAIYNKCTTKSGVQINSERFNLIPEDPFSYELTLSVSQSNCVSKCIEIGLMDDGCKHTSLLLDMVNHTGILCIYDSRSQDLVRTASIPLSKADKFTITIQLDKSSLEVIVDNSIHMTEAVYPSTEQTGIWLRTPYQSAIVDEMSIASVVSSW